MTTWRGRGVLKARRTQPSRIAAHAQTDEGGVLAVRRPKSGGRTARGGRLRRPQQAVFMRWVLYLNVSLFGRQAVRRLRREQRGESGRQRRRSRRTGDERSEFDAAVGGPEEHALAVQAAAARLGQHTPHSPPGLPRPHPPPPPPPPPAPP